MFSILYNIDIMPKSFVYEEEVDFIATKFYFDFKNIFHSSLTIFSDVNGIYLSMCKERYEGQII